MRVEIHQNALDSEVFRFLRECCHLGPLEPPLVDMGLNGSLFTLLAVEYQDEKDPGTPIGMLRVIGDGAFVFQIYDLLVAPQYRGHGTGSALVQAAVARIKEFFPPNRWVTIQLQSQPGTESFYERMGFQILPYSSFGAYMQVIEKT